jgi:hypothetical protein
MDSTQRNKIHHPTEAEDRKFYLGKNGEIFGPLSSPDFQALLDSGELKNYSWFWDTQTTGWNAVDPMPGNPPHLLSRPKLPVESALRSPVEPASALPSLSPLRTATPLSLPSSWCALIATHSELFEGKLVTLTDSNAVFEFDATQVHDLCQGLKLELHLFDSRLETSVQLQAQVTHLRQKGHRFTISIEILSKKLLMEFHSLSEVQGKLNRKGSEKRELQAG